MSPHRKRSALRRERCCVVGGEIETVYGGVMRLWGGASRAQVLALALVGRLMLRTRSKQSGTVVCYATVSGCGSECGCVYVSESVSHGRSAAAVCQVITGWQPFRWKKCDRDASVPRMAVSGWPCSASVWDMASGSSSGQMASKIATSNVRWEPEPLVVARPSIAGLSWAPK
jgi:hypothetical protein